MINSAWANERQELLGRIAKLEQLTRRVPSRFAGGGGTTIPTIYVVAGGNALNAGSGYAFAAGILRRTDTVLVSELPVGSGGSPGDTVTVPAWPIPTGLPLGIGVAQAQFGGAYIFVVNDSRSNFPGDLPIGRRVWVGSPVNLDKVSGGITYRYVCYQIATGL